MNLYATDVASVLARVYADAGHRLGENWDRSAEVYSFPETWSSTALGFGGMGGQAMTTAQTVILMADYNRALVYWAGRFAYETDRRKAMEMIKNLRSEPRRAK